MRSTLGGLVAALVVLFGTAGAADAAARAKGGEQLLEAMEASPETLVGNVVSVRKLDRFGFAATLEVEQALRGDYHATQKLDLVWEELAPSRAPRFAQGDRILAVLAPMPAISIWLERLPDPDARAAARGIAMEGDAFLKGPHPKTVDQLLHYLAMSREARRGEPGVALLIELAADAELPLAESAVRRLSSLDRLPDPLAPDTARRLVAVLLRPDASEALSDGVVALIATRRLEATRSPLEALVARKPRPPAAVFAALAELDDGLSPERTRALLRDAPSRYREVAARSARGPESEALLRRLSRSDPDASVRTAALERLAELEGERAIDPLADALGDPEPEVRRTSVYALAALGEAALPTLLRVMDGNDPTAAQAALASMSLVNSPEAHAAMVDVADHHPDEGLRTLAAIALGRQVGHTH